MRTVIINEDLTESVDRHLANGYRLEMITPADSPREALLSKNGERIRLVSANHAKPPEAGTQNGWAVGRAGMMYRDLIPGRLDGRLIASHIRLTEGGLVADNVHYHKIGFQMIYCLEGQIRVVYQDQGGPFWLEPGDCVLQPPEIRHRVLEAEAGSEVVEIGSPAEHETWIDHDMSLPKTTKIDSAREFRGQFFVRHVAKNAVWRKRGSFEYRDLDLKKSTRGLAEAKVIRFENEFDLRFTDQITAVVFILKGRGIAGSGAVLNEKDCIVFGLGSDAAVTLPAGSEILQLNISLPLSSI